MNSAYFFLPFILVTSLGIYQDTFAVEAYRGETFLDVTNPDGSHTQTIGLTPWILDDGLYQPFIFTDGTTKTVETGYGSVKLNPDGSYSFYKDGKIIGQELFTDKIIAKYADISNLNSWTYPNSVNNDTPTISWNGTSLTSTKSAAIGLLEYKYVNNDGKWKTQLEATNLSAFTNKAFGFDQIIDLNRDSIMFNGIQRNLDNFNNTTFDKTWLTNNKAKVLDFLNGVNFDFDLGFENLYSVTVIDTGVNKSRLIFDYRTDTPLLPNETLIIDPTYSSNNPVDDGYVEDDNSDDVCNVGTLVKDTVATSTYVLTNPIGSVTDCIIAFFDYDISSIPTNAAVTDVDFKYEVTAVPSVANCDYVSMGTVRASDTATNIFTAVLSGGTEMVSNDATCTTVGINKSVDFGATGDSQVQTRVTAGSGFFTFGMRLDSMVLTGASRGSTIGTEEGVYTPDPTLEITYTQGSPPNPVTSMTSANLAANSVDIIWSAPNSFGSGTFQNYTANYTTPWGAPLTFLGNTTGLFLNVTGLAFGTDYSIRISAVTEIPYNTTGSYILNITTTSNTYSLPPTNLVATSGLPTAIDLDWDVATIDNIRGYRIEREDPIDSGWDTLVANTTTTTTAYTDSTVTTQIKYNYRISAMNGTGFSTYSNEDDSYAYHIPDAVTDLSGVATDFSTVDLDWTEPTLYADLIGYRINYTTPYGDPVSIALPNPYTTGTSGSIFDLIPGGNYSFRVAPVTIFGANASGNIINVTTSSFLEPGDLTTGDITNTEDFKIFFDRDDINSTAIQVDVTYSDTYDLSCDLSYQLARTNQTYSNMTETIVSADEVESSFLFINATGDIIHIKCWDVNTGDEAMYVLTITDFPFLDQISNMRNGTYGTYFQIGAIDGVTLMICILAMIGFNRTNPIGGIVFLVITVGVLSFFQIITYPIIMYPALALLMVWGYISTRKDD